MKNLIQNIKNSIYGPAYYEKILTEPMRYSFRYYAALTFFLAIFLTIISSLPLVMHANSFAREFPKKFFAYFPDELEISIVNGLVTSNVTEPYYFPVPIQFLGGKDVSTFIVQHIGVIDTVTPFSMKQFSAYQSAFWLGHDQIAYLDKGGSVKITPFDNTVNYVINEGRLRDMESQLSSYYALIGPLIVIVIFVALTIGFLIPLVYLLLVALLIMVIGRLLKRRFLYGKAYQIGLHAITLPLLINGLLSFTNLSFPGMLFLPTIIMLGVVYLNFQEVHSSVTQDA